MVRLQIEMNENTSIFSRSVVEHAMAVMRSHLQEFSTNMHAKLKAPGFISNTFYKCYPDYSVIMNLQINSSQDIKYHA